MKIVSQRKNLLFMLVCLTLLFIAAQLALFYVHYHVSSLIDSLTSSSIPGTLHHPVILLPILQFLALQCAAYSLFVAWIWFVSVSGGELFRLPVNGAYYLGLFCWLLAVIMLLTVNHYFFPHSFFAALLDRTIFLRQAWHGLMIFSTTVLLLLTLAAFINCIFYRRHAAVGGVFLLLIAGMGACAIYDNSVMRPVPAAQFARPNIILIGLDSLRPDFTGYLGARGMQTPNIDRFLREAAVFTNAYTPLARTYPSWVSMLTARHPVHTSARNNLVQPSRVLENNMLSRRLREAGYETIYATDEKRFSNITEDYGFDRIIGPAMGVNDFLLGGLSDFPLTNLLVNLPPGRFLFPYNYGNRAAAITYEPDSFLRLVKTGLNSLPPKPVFLVVHFCVSHWPFTWARDGEKPGFIQPERYESSVGAVDRQLGSLLQILQDDGLLTNSVVVLLSDHGTTLGLPDDRVTARAKYLGPKSDLKKMTVSRFSSAPENSLNMRRDYSINTSYGQGTDLLSLKQYHSLLAFRDFRQNVPAMKISDTVSLMDIAPTLLDMLGLPPLAGADGVSQRRHFSGRQTEQSPPRAIFMETGDSLSEIETDHIYVEKVIKHEIGIYTVDPVKGLLYMSPEAEASLIHNKQRGILLGDWLLVRYPPRMAVKLVTGKEGKAEFARETVPAFYVLANVRTGQWTIGLDTPFARSAPVKDLLRRLQGFYPGEL